MMLIPYTLLAALFLIVVLLATILYFKKYYQISLRILGLGVFGFFFFSQVLERTLHALVLQPQLDGTTSLSRFPVLYILYAIVSAAIFEEFGRYVIFKMIEKKRELQLRDALAYGLGHGGLELMLLGLGTFLIYVIFLPMLENGQAEHVSPLLQLVLKQVNTWQITLVVFERVIALGIQVLLSIWVFKAVKDKKLHYLGLALLSHAIIDFLPALVQVNWIDNTNLVLLGLFLEGIVLALLTKKYLLRRCDYGIK